MAHDKVIDGEFGPDDDGPAVTSSTPFPLDKAHRLFSYLRGAGGEGYGWREAFRDAHAIFDYAADLIVPPVFGDGPEAVERGHALESSADKFARCNEDQLAAALERCCGTVEPKTERGAVAQAVAVGAIPAWLLPLILEILTRVFRTPKANSARAKMTQDTPQPPKKK